MSSNARPVMKHRCGVVASVFTASLWVFLFICIFDPADRLLGLKEWSFAFCWIVGIVCVTTNPQGAVVSKGLVSYVSLFILIPLVSVLRYLIQPGGEPFEGFGMLKGYVLITFALLLYLTRVDLFDALAKMLTILSILIIFCAVGVALVPDLYAALYVFGELTGIVLVDRRDYGSEVVLLQIYFVTSPMLVMAIAHYYHRSVIAVTHHDRLRSFFLLMLNVTGMLLAGSRNNILVSLLLPLSLWFLHSNYKTVMVAVSGMLLVAAVIVFQAQLRAFFDPEELSNAHKIQLVQDYYDLFGDSLSSLLLGQGLGAYHLWTNKGMFYISELTYFELIRNFGIFGALVVLALLLVPIARAFGRDRADPTATLAFGYAYYLLMCASNPNMFSSMGILILSLMLVVSFRPTSDWQPYRL